MTGTAESPTAEEAATDSLQPPNNEQASRGMGGLSSETEGDTQDPHVGVTEQESAHKLRWSV